MVAQYFGEIPQQSYLYKSKWTTSFNFFCQICGGGGEEESFNFMQQGQRVEEDPPTKLIGQFMHKQKASGEISIEFEVMDKLERPTSSDNIASHTTQTLPTVSE